MRLEVRLAKLLRPRWALGSDGWRGAKLHGEAPSSGRASILPNSGHADVVEAVGLDDLILRWAVRARLRA